MAQNRMMPPALLEQLQGTDTDVLRAARFRSRRRPITGANSKLSHLLRQVHLGATPPVVPRDPA